MPTYLTNSKLWIDLYPIPLFALLISLMLFFLVGESKKNFWKAFGVIFAMALLGITSGQITGQSREPAVSAVIPGILTFIAGITIFIVAAKTTQQQQLASVLIIAFTLTFLVGTFWGAELRIQHEENKKSEEYLSYRAGVLQNIRLQKLIYEKQTLKVKKRLELLQEEK